MTLFGPRLKLKYSVEHDISAVHSTLDSLEWLTEKGYRFDLPDGMGVSASKDMPRDMVRARVLESFDGAWYSSLARRIGRSWTALVRDWPVDAVRAMRLELLPEYVVNLTRYGVGGSYDEAKNELTVNVRTCDPEELAKTIFHEVLHLSIGREVQQHHISHWHTERLIDLIFARLLPQSGLEQDLPEEAYIVDQYFKNGSVPIGQVIEALGADMGT